MKVLNSVLMACSLAIANVAAETVVDPIADVFAVFTSSKDLMNRGRREVDCLELFAGKGRISEAFGKKGRGVLCPRDIKYGHDFRRPAARQEVLDDIYKYKPGMVWMAPPCTLWGNFSRMNYSRQELRRLRRKEMVLLNFCDEVMRLQTSLGGQFALENPRGSDMWRVPKLQGWIISGDAHLSKVDLCSYNMRSIDEQFRLLKPITLLCSNEIFAEKISRLYYAPRTMSTYQSKDRTLLIQASTPLPFPMPWFEPMMKLKDARRHIPLRPFVAGRGAEPVAGHQAGRRAEPVAAKGRSTLSSLQR